MNSSKKLLSIIIPTYNNADYIAETLLSLHKDITDEVEIILINDGSTDATDDKIQQFFLAHPGHKIKYIHKENQGVATTRNVGLKHANGKYIGFVDGDDLVSTDYFSVLLPLLKDEIYDLIEFNLVRDKKYLSDNITSPQQSGDQYEINLTDNHDFSALYPTFRAGQWHLMNKIFHHRIIQDDQFVDGRRYEDMIFCPFQYLKCSKILKVNKNLYFYRVNTAGITENIKKIDADHIFYAMQKMCTYIEQHPKSKTAGTLMIVNCFLEGRKILRKSTGYYCYQQSDIALFNQVLSLCERSVIKNKVLFKMKHPLMDKFISFINYKISHCFSKK